MISRGLAPWLLVLGVATCSCSKDPEYDGCYVERPAFLVRVSAGARNLPGDTRLNVKYGAGTEEYLLEHPPERPDVVFCTLLSPELEGDAMSAVDAGGSVQELLCELWTQGAATLTVTAEGYPTQDLTLRAQRDRCGIETVDYEVVLVRPDAGRP
ncbi:MAG TPA: hypothetical protein VK524_15110 [Polyangiaceae bacterium]|nr:hypothetical protein [Polyangiaceae bacterium]